MSENLKKWPEEIVTPSGKSTWMGGAYTLAFVCSNKGNFVLKGYMKEVEEHLKKMRDKEGLKYYVNYTLWHSGKHRSILDFYKENVGISAPRKSLSEKSRWTKKSRCYHLYQYTSPYSGEKRDRKELYFKRLPKRWVPEFDTL